MSRVNSLLFQVAAVINSSMPTTVVTPSVATSSTPSSGGGIRSNTTTGAAPPRVPPSRTQPDMNRERMMFMWLSLVGKTVEVKMRNQTIYEGILSGVKPEKDFDIALKYARELPTGNKLSGPIYEEMLVPGKEVASLTAHDVPVAGIDKDKGPHLSGFKTDSEILPRSSLAGKERVLQRWDSKTDDALDKPLETSSLDYTRVTGRGGGGAHWDQFAVNERKFNVKSTYNEALYTTTLDTSKISPEKQRRAERIAKEIEHSQNYGGKEEGTGVEDEEALFSAVQGTGGYATGTKQQQQQSINQHQKPQLSPEQISERARMKADFESHLRMLDAGHRHHKVAAASAGNTRLNALNLEPASVRVSQLAGSRASPKQSSSSSSSISPSPPQPLTQENLKSHNQALQSSGSFAATNRQQQQQTPGSKHSLLGASPVLTGANRRPIPQLPPSAAAAGVSEMKGINALNLEPALPKLPEKDREEWISSNASPQLGKAGGGKGVPRGGVWQQQQQVGGGLLEPAAGTTTPPLTTAKGGGGKGKGGKGGQSLSIPQGSPQGGPYQTGGAVTATIHHQPSQLMMNAVHNAQNAQIQQQQVDAGKPPVGGGKGTAAAAAGSGGSRRNLTLEGTQGGKRSGAFSFNPNANTFTPSSTGMPTQGGGATLNINVTPGGSLSGTLKNVNYDTYEAPASSAAATAAAAGPQQGSAATSLPPPPSSSSDNGITKQSGGSSQIPQGGRQQQQSQTEQQQQQYQGVAAAGGGGRGGPLSNTQGGPSPPPPLPPHGPMMGGPIHPGMMPTQGGPIHPGMMIPMPAPPHYPGFMTTAGLPMPLPNITPPLFMPLCDSKSLDTSTLAEIEDRLLESSENENTPAVSTQWPDGSKSSSYRDIISASSSAAAGGAGGGAMFMGPPTIASPQGGYIPLIPGQAGAAGSVSGPPHMMQPPSGPPPMGSPMLPGGMPPMGMMPIPAGPPAGAPGMYQYSGPMQQQPPPMPAQQGGSSTSGGPSSNPQGGGMHVPLPGGMYPPPMYGGMPPPPYYAAVAAQQMGGDNSAGGSRGGGYMMGGGPGVLVTPGSQGDNAEGGGNGSLMPSPPQQQQRGRGYYSGGGQQQQGQQGQQGSRQQGHRGGGGYHGNNNQQQ